MKNLLEFSDTCNIGGGGRFGGTGTAYWKMSNLGNRPVGQIDFEKKVIDKIKTWTLYNKCSEFELLNAFFKSGGKLVSPEYFYSNINEIKRSCRSSGCELIYNYSKNVLKGRLPSEVESKFLTDLWKLSPRDAYKYAKYVIRNRLPTEYEKDCRELDYIRFIENKGHAIEEILINNSLLSYYYYRNYSYLPEVVHNFMIATQLSGDRYANLYFKQRTKDDKVIKNRLKMLDGSKTVTEVIREMKG